MILKCIFDELNLKIGDELTLLELDDRIEKFINDDNIETPLMSLDADAIIAEGEYVYFIDNSETFNRIHFEVLENTHDENAKIKIIGFD